MPRARGPRPLSSVTNVALSRLIAKDSGRILGPQAGRCRRLPFRGCVRGPILLGSLSPVFRAIASRRDSIVRLAAVAAFTLSSVACSSNGGSGSGKQRASVTPTSTVISTSTSAPTATVEAALSVAQIEDLVRRGYEGLRLNGLVLGDTQLPDDSLVTASGVTDVMELCVHDGGSGANRDNPNFAVGVLGYCSRAGDYLKFLAQHTVGEVSQTFTTANHQWGLVNKAKIAEFPAVASDPTYWMAVCNRSYGWTGQCSSPTPLPTYSLDGQKIADALQRGFLNVTIDFRNLSNGDFADPDKDLQRLATCDAGLSLGASDTGAAYENALQECLILGQATKDLYGATSRPAFSEANGLLGAAFERILVIAHANGVAIDEPALRAKATTSFSATAP